ncbi:MAG: amino acid adenylation domain-containing protein [Chloroflexi bacterium]|nr:amino acid adenylation domain-containing protein [Chloroflexota bacterium]
MIYLLHQALEESALRYPDHPAFRFQNQALTYADLARRAAQLARTLQEQGIGKHDRVGVFLDKSLETAISIYGIMMAGGAYIPLDPKSPVTRLVSIIEDCQLTGIIAQDSRAQVLDEAAGLTPILRFVVGTQATTASSVRSVSWQEVEAQPPGLLSPVRLMEQDLAYIMYTSGSTGKPKGIMHTHSSGLSYARMSAATYDVNHDDRLSNHSPLHFDMSTFDYLTAVLCGATTTIIPEAYTLFPVNLAKLIEADRLTIWYSVPFALIQLITRGVLEERDLSAIRWVLYGGEPFPLGHLRALMDRLPQARFSNVYGPAEVNQCTYYHLPPPTAWPADWDNIPLGVIWDNADSLIVDTEDQPVPPGAVGELVVRTPTMMRGYWRRPDLNARAFYRREVFPDFEAVYYRTGDLVRENADGLLEFLGRKDHQVKIRGFRVELAEVDTALSSHEAIEHGAAFVIRREEGDVLAGAVMLKPNAQVSAETLIAYLRDRLPVYAVPAAIYFLEAMPRTGTGKIDRKALHVAALHAE